MASSERVTSTGLPKTVVVLTGLALLPIAAFIAWVATRERVPAAGVWLVILGNAAWVLGSLALFLAVSPTALGFVIAQALVVVALAEMEYVGLRKAA